MRTFQQFASEARQLRIRRGGGDPFTHYDDGKRKPIDLSAIHKKGNEAAASTEKAKKQREKANKRADTQNRMDAAGRKLGLPEELELDEGMTMKDFKQQRSRQKQKEKRAAEKTSPTRRAGIHADKASPERAARHRANVDPDFEGNDERNYPGGKLNPKKVRKAKALGELGEGIGMTMASALGNPPPLSKRMKLKQALIINKIESDAKKNKKKKYSGKALGEDNVQELFITKLTPEQKRKKKVETLIRLMQHAKDPAADVAKTKKEDYDLSETSLTRVMSKSKKGGMAIMSAQRGDKSKSENKARSKQLERDVRGAGLPGPTKVAGRYTENPGTPDEKKVGEKSHIITPGKKGKRKFKKVIEKLGRKYNQDSVLLQRKGGGEATLKGTSKTSWPGQGKNVKIGGMKPGRTGEFDTKVKNKTFTVEH